MAALLLRQGPSAYAEETTGQSQIVIKGSYAGKEICGELIEQWTKDGHEGKVRYWPAENVACARMLLKHEGDIVLRSSEWDYTDKQVLSQTCRNWPNEPHQFRLGVFAVAVVVNATNPLRRILTRDLERIFTGEIKNWNEVSGAEVGGPVVAYCPSLNTNESYIFRIKAMRRSAYGKGIGVIDSREKLLALIAAEPRAIGIILMDPEEAKPKENVRYLAVIRSSQIKRDGQWRSLEELFPSKPGDAGFRWERAIAPTKTSIYDGSYAIVDELSLFADAQAKVAAMRFCEYSVNDDVSKILRKHCLFPESERRQYIAAANLAAYKSGRGQRLSAIGIDDGSKAISDLALEYVKAKAVVQLGYVATDSDVTAIGMFVRIGADATTLPADLPTAGDAFASSMASSMPTSAPAAAPSITPFVKAGGKELLLLGDKPSSRAMELHGEKWKSLGVDKDVKPDGTGPKEYVLAGRAAAIIVNPTNKIQSLTMDQVRMVFNGEIDDWAAFGKTGHAGHVARPGMGKTETKINRFGLKMTDPVVAIFSRECLQPVNYGRVTLKKDSNDVIAAVGMDPQAIGFVDLAACSNRPLGVNSGAEGAENPFGGTANVKVLAIQVGLGEKAKIMRPTEENIRNAMYPLSQRLYLYVHPKASDVAKDFAKFLATCGGSEATPYADTVKSVMEAYAKHGLISLADAAIERRAKDAAAAARAAAAKAEKEKAAGGKATKKPAR